ncbi:hypothetical protein DAVIS_02029 [Mycobacterium marinum]|uniref:Uncharacterized protein n=1 Tax=Mycobacterium marinum TaxID=1781 RepID=A0A3E2MXP6_MYCMR|nr:hypothetical protein DAVIS_02029 [Mycobacterium marinum]
MAAAAEALPAVLDQATTENLSLTVLASGGKRYAAMAMVIADTFVSVRDRVCRLASDIDNNDIDNKLSIIDPQAAS